MSRVSEVALNMVVCPFCTTDHKLNDNIKMIADEFKSICKNCNNEFIVFSEPVLKITTTVLK